MISPNNSVPPRQTLLGGDPTPAEIERQRIADEHAEKVRTLVFEVWLQAYREGEKHDGWR